MNDPLQYLIDAADDDPLITQAELYDVESIPVTKNLKLPGVPYCARWDFLPTEEYKRFDAVYRNGTRLSRKEFIRCVHEGRASVQLYAFSNKICGQLRPVVRRMLDRQRKRTEA